MIAKIVKPFLVLVLWGACSSPPKVPEAMPECPASCVVLGHFDCPEAYTSKPGECVRRCEHVASLGYLWTDASSGPLCVRKATTLEQVRACNVRCLR